MKGLADDEVVEDGEGEEVKVGSKCIRMMVVNVCSALARDQIERRQRLLPTIIGLLITACDDNCFRQLSPCPLSPSAIIIAPPALHCRLAGDPSPCPTLHFSP